MNAQFVKKWMIIFNEKVQENKTYLTELDTPIGDSDHGSNMSRGMSAVIEALDNDKPATAADALKVIAKNLLSKVGGSAGPLYGSAFLAMAKEVTEDNSLGQLITVGSEAIQKRGKSTVGEKTMVDVWAPVAEALMHGNLELTFIDDSVEATKAMKATKGRASYVGERSMGHLDPGAYSSGLLFKALLEAEDGGE